MEVCQLQRHQSGLFLGGGHPTHYPRGSCDSLSSSGYSNSEPGAARASSFRESSYIFSPDRRRRHRFNSLHSEPSSYNDNDLDLDLIYLETLEEDYKRALNSLLPQLSIAKMDPLSQVFCLRWNNHRNNLLSVFDHLLQTEAFCDVTLACDGSSIKCHKMILSACSSYFQTLFMENTCEHPIVFLKDIKYNEIRAILDYMYKGEVNVAQEELPGLLKVAELLKVKGLVEEEREKLLNSSKEGGRPLISVAPTENDGNKNNNGVPPSIVNGEVKRNGKEDVRGFNMYGPAGLPIWPLSGMFPGAHNLFTEQGTNNKESSPSSPNERRSDWGSGHKRKKMSGGHHAPPKDPVISPHHNNSRKEDDQPIESNMNRSESMEMDEKGQGSQQTNGSSGSHSNEKGGIANYVPNQRLEWKRYKQYTRNDIMAAIDEVRKGMSALQASRKFGVPSRTLYDKVKKMGITTGRQMQRKSMPQYPASFPSLSSISDTYKDLKDNEDMNDSDIDTGRPSMVAPTFPSYMLNIMEKMKEAEGNGGGEGKHGISPINLSNMLANANNRSSSDMMRPESSNSPINAVKRSSEGSAPQSPSSGENESSSNDQESNGVTTSGEIRAQFMADLRRLGTGGGGNSIVGDSNRGYSDDIPLSPSKSPSETADNLLPPRKRKVSQEHHLQALLTAAAVASAAEKSAENGLDRRVEVKDECDGNRSPN
ncbi:uncharacterized protein [Lepeophtheirus salmonis]|uniref:uncharacterized protein isoform X2 n=1 Tax=Lepeophtheirus salmonis TaxID=72036 RepID=UPI001AE581F1|nr:uncharacterized protein LOC121121081 isoform X2 [Lepeophtheirus salmonis]